MLALSAHASGFYHPDDISAASTRFRSASEQLLAPFEERQEAARALSSALVRYQESLDLLGERADAAERARLVELRAGYNTDFARVEAFADAVVGDFDAAFTSAMERAIAAVDPAAVECRAQIPKGTRLPGMPGRTERNPACTGEDLSARIAEAMDADPALGPAVDAVVARSWPDLEIDRKPQAATGPEGRHVDVGAWLRSTRRDELRAVQLADDRARIGLEAAVEQTTSPADLEPRLEEARALTAATAQQRAALAAPVLAAADAAFARWSEDDVGWCAQPGVLGGCTGTDATQELVGRLLEDKKVAKALRK